MPERHEVTQQIRSQFLGAAATLRNSIVYLEAGAAESVSQSVGTAFLRGLGAAHLLELEAAGSRDAAVCELLTGKAVNKVIVLSTKLLTQTHSSVLKALKAHPKVVSCNILCSVSPEAHASQPGTMLGASPYDEYANALAEDLAEVRRRPPAAALLSQQDMSSTSGHVSITVTHAPMLIAALVNNAFVLPACSSAVTQARIGPAPAGFFPPDARLLGEDGLDSSAACGLKLLAHQLVHIAASLNLRLESFSLGGTSALVGEEVSAQPVPRGENGQPLGGSAALLLIDRGLDLATPVSHGPHVLDRIVEMLPRLGKRARDENDPPEQIHCRSSAVAVPMPSSPADRQQADDSAPEHVGQLPGSLSHPADDKAEGRLQALMQRRGSDALVVLRKWLREAIRADSAAQAPNLRFKAGSVPASELHALADALCCTSAAAARNSSLIQLARAAAAVLPADGTNAEAPAQAKHDSMHRQEQALQLAAEDGVSSVFQEMRQLLKGVATSAEGDAAALSVQDVLTLVITVHATLGSRPGPGGLRLFAEGPQEHARESQELRDAIVSAVEQAPELASRADQEQHLRWLSDLGLRLQRAKTQADAMAAEIDYDARALHLQLQDQAEDAVARLAGIAVQHSRLRDPPPVGMPLVQHVASRIRARAPVHATHHDVASLRGILTSGLGRFGIGAKKAAPQLHDYSTVIIFVIGGVCMAELRAFAESLSAMAGFNAEAADGPRFLLGGTALVGPQDICQHALGW